VGNSPAETQRLKGLEKIRNGWFLFLDADERISLNLAEQIKRAVASGAGGNSAYFVLRRNYYRDKPVHLHHPDYQLRLFKKSETNSLPSRIHRIPQIKGKAGRLEGELAHYFFPSVSDYVAKMTQYTAIEASYWREEGRRIGGWKSFYYLVLRPKWRFFQYYFLKKGFLDGFFGFFYAFSSAYYEIMVAALVMADEKETKP
jgi:glycosyltransferase involved in cell wall biosynthesis